MEGQQISAKSTAALLMEFDTVSSEQFDTRSKNEKIVTLLNERRRLRRDSSESVKEVKAWENNFDCMLVWDKSLTYSWWVFEEYEQFKLSIKEIIEAYINENIVDNLLSINEWLVKEYTPYNAIDLLQSFVDIGGEIFKDARPRNELESKSIDAFVRSKAKTISLK